jgi:hypothetical protein
MAARRPLTAGPRARVPSPRAPAVATSPSRPNAQPPAGSARSWVAPSASAAAAMRARATATTNHRAPAAAASPAHPNARTLAGRARCSVVPRVSAPAAMPGARAAATTSPRVTAAATSPSRPSARTPAGRVRGWVAPSASAAATTLDNRPTRARSTGVTFARRSRRSRDGALQRPAREATGRSREDVPDEDGDPVGAPVDRDRGKDGLQSSAGRLGSARGLRACARSSVARPREAYRPRGS